MQLKKVIALFLCLLLCMQVLTGSVFATDANVKSISGDGVKVEFQAGTILLYRVDGNDVIQMSKPSSMGYPIINGEPLQDFAVASCEVEQNASGLMGNGERMTIVSVSISTGLIRTYVIETSNTQKCTIYTTTTYKAEDNAVNVDWFVDNEFELFGVDDKIWSFHGGGEGPIHYNDTIREIRFDDSDVFSRENRQDYSAAAIPAADIYIAHGGILVGDASRTRRELHTPVNETANSATVAIKWRGKTVGTDTPTPAGESFVNVHSGDYYSGLRGYKNAMETLDIVMQTNVSERNYQLRWDAWGWSTDWTVDLIIGELDKLQSIGVKQIAVDDGWFNHGGDWQLNPSKFPNGNADMIRLVNAIHARGMSALLWWRPCDGGKDNSTLHKEHPEYFIMNANGTTAKLGSPGKTDPTAWSADAGYALCPTSQGAIQATVDFVNRAMNEWGFDGFKGDYVWSLPKCYNPAHNHPYPEESTEKEELFYKASYEAMIANDPDVFNLVCNCGAPQDYYSLKYMTQVITSDPTSLDQTRTRVKMFKALMGDDYPVTTDHNQSWYSTAVGTGAVLIEKSSFNGADLENYAKWLAIADEVQLHKGNFIGDLYCYGFDPYETYVVEKDGTMYYAFYRDGSRFTTVGYPEIELRGLDPEKMYRIVDYVNDRVVATNLMGSNAVFTTRFTKDLLVKAVEITVPDDPSIINPDWGYEIVDDRDAAVVYTGTWVDDSNVDFYEETARYTNVANSTVQFRFAGTSIRWYGQKDTNFGTADVYLNDELVSTVNANGPAESNVRLFEMTDLTPAIYTLKIVCKTGVIDVDKFAYQAATPELNYTRVDALSGQITYSGTWTEDHNEANYLSNAMGTTEFGATATMTFEGTAVQWFGQRMSEFGVAMVYIDGEMVETVYTFGPDSYGNLLFERTDLTPGTHTIQIVHSLKYIDIDYLTYAMAETIDPIEPELQIVDAADSSLVYTGTWHDDNNSDFEGGFARYTAQSGATVSLTFQGTTIQWYGQNDTNFGTAKVYIDDELIETVNLNGQMVAQKLLFEKTGLESGSHTIKILCESPVVDIDYLAFK